MTEYMKKKLNCHGTINNIMLTPGKEIKSEGNTKYPGVIVNEKLEVESQIEKDRIIKSGKGRSDNENSHYEEMKDHENIH